MDHAEFTAMIVTPDTPALTDFERVAAYAHGAGKDELWQALGRAGLHPLYRHLLAQALHQRVLEAQAREREEARERQQALQDDESARREQEQAPPRRRRVR